MGCFNSKESHAGAPATGGASKPAAKHHHGGSHTKPKPAAPDAMLAKSFEYIQQLGKGGTGDTGLFKDLQSGEEVAIKLIKRPLPKVIMPNILREVTIQAELGEGHVNIVEAKEVLLTDHHLCLVMEYAAGNSLTGYVADKWQHAQQTGLFLSEDEARYYFRQFVTAVAYCHAHNVAHRDLKLDNTLLDGKTPGRVKLCDFGFAKQWEESNRNMFTHIGTPVYMSPEQLQDGDTNGQGYLGTAVDVWAAGVLLIVMLLGTFPFDHTENPDPNCKEAHTEVWAQQTKGSWSEVPHIKKAVQKLSAEVKDLLDHILVPKEEERITIPEIEAHPWYRQKLPKEYAAAEEALRKDQARVEAYVSSRSISTAAKAQRDQQLKDIVEQAGQRPAAGGGQLVRIDLREAAVVQNPTSGGGGLADLAEE